LLVSLVVYGSDAPTPSKDGLEILTAVVVPTREGIEASPSGPGPTREGIEVTGLLGLLNRLSWCRASLISIFWLLKILNIVNPVWWARLALIQRYQGGRVSAEIFNP